MSYSMPQLRLQHMKTKITLEFAEEFNLQFIQCSRILEVDGCESPGHQTVKYLWSPVGMPGTLQWSGRFLLCYYASLLGMVCQTLMWVVFPFITIASGQVMTIRTCSYLIAMTIYRAHFSSHNFPLLATSSHLGIILSSYSTDEAEWYWRRILWARALLTNSWRAESRESLGKLC